MSDPKVDGRFVPAREVRMLFPNLYEAKAVTRNGKAVGEPKFSARLKIASTDTKTIDAIKAKAVEVAKAHFGANVDLKSLKWPFTDGAKEAERSKAKGKDGSIFEGGFIVTSRSKYQPRLSIFQGANKAPQELADATLAAAKGKFYSGCYVLPQLNFVAYDAVGEGGKPGVTAYLDQVMWVKDGERIGGSSAAEAFKGYQGSVTDENPLDTGLDDDAF